MNNRLTASVGSALFLALLGVAQAAQPQASRGYVEYVNELQDIDIHPDATYTESVHLKYKVLDKAGLDFVRRRTLSYSQSLSDVTIGQAYTLKADGTKIPVPKGNYQIDTQSGAAGAAPLDSDYKTEAIIFPDVQVGDSIVLDYLYNVKEASFPNIYSFSATFSDAAIVDDSQVRITAPDSLRLRTAARGVGGGVISHIGGKTTWSWHYHNATLHPSPHQLSESRFEYAPQILASTLTNYGELARAYELRAHSKAAVTPRIQALANTITQRAKTPRDIAKTIHDWVAENIRYENNAIGVGSVVPHDTDHILDNKIGDCKDHALLVEALLAAKGIASTTVLIGTRSIYHLPELPISQIFDHVINYIPSLKLYVDSTWSAVPFGMLDFNESSKPTIHTGLFDGIDYTPAQDTANNFGRTVGETTFHADGSADGTIDIVTSGNMSLSSRSFFRKWDPLPNKQVYFPRMFRTMGYRGDGSFTAHDSPDSQNEAFHFKLTFHIDNALDFSGPGALSFEPFIPSIGISIRSYGFTSLTERPAHDYPCSGATISTEVISHMPNNVQVVGMPKNVEVTNGPRSYHSEYTLSGNTVTSKRTLVDSTTTNLCTPADYDLAQPVEATVIKDLRRVFIFR